MNKRILITIIIIISIVASVWLFLVNKQKLPSLVFISSVPENNAVFVDIKGEIVISLNRNIAQEDGDALKVKILPDEKVKIAYQGNKIRISPETELKTNTKYEIFIYHKEKEIYKMSFTTFPFTEQQIVEEGSKQTEADLAFDEKYKSFLTNYPWYQSLPIEKNEYRIVYDFEKNSFRIRFKLFVQEGQKVLLIQKAIEDLKSIGLREPIEYYIIDYQP